MAIGKVGSFATVAPIQGNPIGDAMAQVEDNAFRYRAEQRLEEERKRLAKEKADAELETDLGKIKSDTVKFPTRNALIIDAMTKLKQGVGQKAKEMNEGKISRLDYNIYKSNAESQIALIDQSAKRINAQAAAYAKDVAEGKIPSGFEENALNFGGAYDKNNIALELQPDGTMIANVYDDNGNILDKGDLSAIGQNAFTPVYKYDLDKDKQEFIKAYPKVLNEQFIGNTKVGTKGIAPEIEKAMDLKIEATVKDRNALAIKAKEITGIANPNVKDPNIIEEVRKKLKDEYMGLYAQEKMIDEATGRATEQRLRAKQAKEDAEKEIMVGKPTVINKPGYVVTGVTLQKGTKSHPLGNVIIDSGQGKKEKATNVYVSPGGKMYLRVEQTGFEGDSKRTTRYTEKGLKRKAEAEAKKIAFTPEFDDIEDVTISNKTPKVVLYDFGKDDSQIGRFALKMGYDGAESLQTDFIDRSGGDKFITTPDERKQPKKSISRSQIAEKAKASGYTPKEYEKLLRQKGIEIK